MTSTESINHAVIEALNARDFAALAARVNEDVAISGIGEGMDNGRDALRDRLARHFAAHDESYADALVMSDALGHNIAIRLTARGTSSGGSYSKEKILLLEVEDGVVTRIAFFAGS
ncbi:nuclear transport factor 2 family protein [Shinella sp. CPCC 101442]|uniref:nuclear transport factor 2 family protein n=1 Tax=Shinella sp. CPCC 101442 TaxID=2932265 RepID=UPI0021539324|nr:nuclear transport factor 2 family protein [Shinella sp. CPCC 101442]MCR6500157.1 nuclear transport factor 2 family protein [Shinella sp. CPCC 101442]